MRCLYLMDRLHFSITCIYGEQIKSMSQAQTLIVCHSGEQKQNMAIQLWSLGESSPRC